MLFSGKLACLPSWQKVREWNSNGCRNPLEVHPEWDLVERGLSHKEITNKSLSSYLQMSCTHANWPSQWWRNGAGHSLALSTACRADATLGGPTWNPNALPFSVPLFRSSCKVLRWALLNFPSFSPAHFPSLLSATPPPCPPAHQLLPKSEMELMCLHAW